MTAIPEQIDIQINEKCNARCAWCVQEATYKPKTVSDPAFIASVEKHIEDFLALGGRKVIITGGEPTLNMPRLEAVLDYLMSLPELELVVMYTNGSQLLKSKGDKTIAQSLLEHGLQCVNHSVHSDDPEKNRAIFRVKSIPDPSVVASHLRDIGLPFRCCATLQKGGIETVDDVVRYLDFAKANGANDVYFRELFKIDREKAFDTKPIDYAEKISVPITPIIEELVHKGYAQVGHRDAFQGRKKSELAFVTPKGFPFFTSTLEIGREEADKLPYLVVHPDGKLHSTWMGPEFEIKSLRETVLNSAHASRKAIYIEKDSMLLRAGG